MKKDCNSYRRLKRYIAQTVMQGRAIGELYVKFEGGWRPDWLKEEVGMSEILNI